MMKIRTIRPIRQVKSRPALKNPTKYKLREVKAIVIHYTANTKATAVQNARYLDNSNKRYSSWHYVCDENGTIACIPEEEVAYHVGSKTYTDLGKSLFIDGWNPNYSTLGVEICNNGDWEAAAERAADVTAWLCSKYGLHVDDVFRHYDITGKICPKPFVDDIEAWKRFLVMVAEKYEKHC